MKGLQLLPVNTVFRSLNKKTNQVQKVVTGKGPILGRIKNQVVSGYEIHVGNTVSPAPIFDDDGAQDGTGLVLGTYLHGLFHNDNFLNAFLGYLIEKKYDPLLGMQSTPEAGPKHLNEYLTSDSKSDPFDDLAAVVELNVDMEALYKIIGLY